MFYNLSLAYGVFPGCLHIQRYPRLAMGVRNLVRLATYVKATSLQGPKSQGLNEFPSKCCSFLLGYDAAPLNLLPPISNWFHKVLFTFMWLKECQKGGGLTKMWNLEGKHCLKSACFPGKASSSPLLPSAFPLEQTRHPHLFHKKLQPQITASLTKPQITSTTSM